MLPHVPEIDASLRRSIEKDYERFADAFPPDVEGYILEKYRADVSGRYAGLRTKNPFGKASGQLSFNLNQVRDDAEAGLGFVVLKTVIAQDKQGKQAMQDWAMKETRMHLEPIAGRRVGRLGFTVTWKGRGWHESFEAYLAFVRKSLAVAREAGMVVAASCKYHLPAPGETEWRVAEYEYTTRELLRTWRQAGGLGLGSSAQEPLLLEKDFSPTLAGSDRATQQEKILEWLRTVPGLVKAAVAPGDVVLGIKMMNVVFDDAFQLRALRELIEGHSDGQGADFITYANRLFDPKKEFLGKVGVAYGGPDLSDRNLLILGMLREAELAGELKRPVPPISATGDVHSGKMAVEYALQGAESVQMHTIFQLPDIYYGMRNGTKSRQALHQLFFHPADGLVPWMLHVRQHLGIVDKGGVTRFLDVSGWYRTGERFQKTAERRVGSH